MRFSAAIRTLAKDVGAGTHLFLRFLPRTDGDASDFFVTPLATVVSAAQPVQSPQWATFAVEADMPETADSFMIGLAMSGNGVAWFGDLEFSAIMHSD